MAKRKQSDHYDGKKFFNPTLKEQFSPGFSEAFRLIRAGREKWPKNVVNCGISRLDERLKPDDLALTFVNHATFLIQFSQLNILTDPVWANCASPVSWFGPKRVRPCGISFDCLPKIDIILLSHNHYDHLDIETLKKLNTRFSPKVFVPIGDKTLIESIGIKNVQEFDWWDDLQVDADTCITFAPTQHSSARGLFDRDKSLWGSYFIENGKRSIYFGGDSGYSTHFTEIRKRLGSPEIALLGIGAYLPDWFMKAIHMNPAEAVIAYKDLGAQLGVGMHFGTFQLASEGFTQPQQDLKNALEKEGISEDRFIALHEGETKIYRTDDSSNSLKEIAHLD
jgi:L-ascorbate metabolism protein UlaG (beta-lactamase superfamily)